MKRTPLAAAIAAASALLFVNAPTAALAGGHPIIEHWEEAISGVAQDDFGPGWCEPLVDFEVVYDWHEVGTGNFRQRGDGNYYGQSTYHFTGVFTNTETERYLTVIFDGMNKDQKIVANDDGTITIAVHDNGHVLLQTQEGSQILSVGRQHSYDVVIDTNGTPGDYTDDTLLSESPLTKVVGNGFEWDFCQILADNIG